LHLAEKNAAWRACRSRFGVMAGVRVKQRPRGVLPAACQEWNVRRAPFEAHARELFMFRHTSCPQFESRPAKPDPVYTHKLQELLGGAYGEMTVAMQYLDETAGCPASTRT
jgi:hypothetical protein